MKIIPLCLVFLLAVTAFAAIGCNDRPDDPGDDQGDVTTQTSGGSEQEPSTGEDGETDPERVINFYYSMDIDGNGFWENVRALDYITNIDVILASLPHNVHRVSDDELQNEINMIMASFPSDQRVTDREVEYGDRVNIDYVGSINGVEFPGGSTGGMGTEVTAGSMDYIDDFLFQIIGYMPGETVNVEVTFPDNYHAEDLAGKDALFITEINYIVGAPELNDQFVYSNFHDFYGWSNVAEMETDIRNNLQITDIRAYLSTLQVREIPNVIINYFEQSMLHSYAEAAGHYGMELDEFLLAYSGILSIDELMAMNNDSIREMATLQLFIQTIAEHENISVNRQDVADYFEQYFGSDDFSMFEEEYGLPYLLQFILGEKVLNLVAESLYAR